MNEFSRFGSLNTFLSTRSQQKYDHILFRLIGDTLLIVVIIVIMIIITVIIIFDE